MVTEHVGAGHLAALEAQLDANVRTTYRMAAKTLTDGFTELMRIDVDVAFDPMALGLLPG